MALHNTNLTMRLIEGLSAMGYKETSPTTHYRVFIPPPHILDKSPKLRIYVGKHAALRHSISGLVTETRPASGRFRTYVLSRATP